MNKVSQITIVGCFCIAIQCKTQTHIDEKKINSIYVVNPNGSGSVKVILERKTIRDFVGILNNGKAEPLKFASHYFVDLVHDTGVIHLALNGDAVSINGIKYRLNCNIEQWLDENVIVR